MKNNPIVWCEIYVQDMPRAKRFYESVFKLELKQLESPELEMWGFPMGTDKTGASGALVKMPGVSSGGGGTISYFHCEDVAEEAARAAKAGGRIHKPKTSIGPYGHIALVIDTEGNMIGLHTPPATMK